MKLFLLLFLLLLLVPFTAQAGFQGRFSGTGTSLMHKSGNRRPCEEIFLNFQRGEKELKILEGGYRCGNVQATFDPFILVIRNGRIFADGVDVGTFSENRLDLFFANREEDFTYHWLLEFKGEELSYLEEWTDGGKPALTVQGNLKTVQPK
jgi:hypothetical protein